MTLTLLDVRPMRKFTNSRRKIDIGAYLDEFYRIHTELANRALDFIENHDLKATFYEEKNGVSGESAANRKEEKP